MVTFLVLNQFLCCDHSYESSRRDDSNEWSQHRIQLKWNEITQKILTACIITCSSVYIIIKKALFYYTVSLLQFAAVLFVMGHLELIVEVFETFTFLHCYFYHSSTYKYLSCKNCCIMSYLIFILFAMINKRIIVLSHLEPVTVQKSLSYTSSKKIST